MARAIIALGSHEHRLPNAEIIERADTLWQAYAQSLGIDPRDLGSAAGNPDVLRVGELIQAKLAPLLSAAHKGMYKPGIIDEIENLQSYIGGLTGAACKEWML